MAATLALSSRGPPEEAANGENEEYHEQHLRNPGSARRNAGEAQSCGDEGNDEEDSSVIEHLDSPGERSGAGSRAAS